MSATVEYVAPPVALTGAAPQTLAGKTVKLEVCRVDAAGPSLSSKGSDPAVAAIEAGADGALWVLGPRRVLVRYTVASGDGCSLQLDPGFGKGGAVTLGKDAAAYDALAIAPDGDAVVSGKWQPPLRVTPKGVVAPACPDPADKKPIHAAAGQVHAAYGGRLVDLDAGCKGEAPPIADWPNQDAFAEHVPDGEGMIVWGHPGDFDLVARYGADGKRQVAFGAKDTFGSIHDVERWGQRFAVLDFNRRAISLWDAAGAPVGTLDLRAAGLDFINVADLTRHGDDVFLAVDGDPGAVHQVSDGAIVRIRGL